MAGLKNLYFLVSISDSLPSPAERHFLGHLHWRVLVSNGREKAFLAIATHETRFLVCVCVCVTLVFF